MLYVRRDSDDVLLGVTDPWLCWSNVSLDSEAEYLEMLYFLSAFGSTKEKGERFGIEKCDCTASCPLSTVHFHCTARVSTVLIHPCQRQARHVWMGSRDALHVPTFTGNGKLKFMYARQPFEYAHHSVMTVYFRKCNSIIIFYNKYL